MIDQEHISQRAVGPTYRNPDTKEKYRDKGPFDDQRERINQVSRADDTYKNFSVGIQDMDDAIMFYFKEVIRPTVSVNGEQVAVPVMYGNPERWKSAQKDGMYRDKDGKRQLPVILFKRNSLKKSRNLANKIDANRPHNFYITQAHYSRRNPYQDFNSALNRKPEFEFISTVVPDFVELEYSCIILTDFIEQMNPIVESVNFASDSFWGRKEKFKFQSFVNSIKTEVMGSGQEDRRVKSEFDIKLNGYIVPQTVLTNPYVTRKTRNKTTLRINFSEQTLTGARALEVL